MTDRMSAAERVQRERWLKPNAHLFIRPDFERFYAPGQAPDWMREVMERARHPAFTRPPEPVPTATPAAEKSAATRALAPPLGPMPSWSELFWKHWLLARKYNPDQPRVPAGQTGGGQWTSGEGGAGQSELNNRNPRTRLASATIIRLCRAVGISRVTDGRVLSWSAIYECADGFTFKLGGPGHIVRPLAVDPRR